MATTLINVSNRLPVTMNDGKITKSSGGLVAALEGLSAEKYKIDWIGWPGGVTEPAREAEVERELIDEHGCIPVFLSAEEAEAHYEGFSNSSLWPLLHYMPDYLRYEPGWWEQYRAVNQRFADKVLATAREGDLVWVHDYQLLLLPAMLRAAAPGLRIGFFLHTPFPAYEVFRCHPRRAELVAGMLGADLLGFHTFGYLRHFRSAAAIIVGVFLTVIVLRDAGQTLHIVRHPDYTLVRAAEGVAKIVRADPAGNPLVLSISGSDLSLITGVPSICDDFGTLELPDRVRRYRPGWYATWNQIEDDKMDALTPLYRPIRVASFPAMDDPARNQLILYRPRPQGPNPEAAQVAIDPYLVRSRRRSVSSRAKRNSLH